MTTWNRVAGDTNDTIVAYLYGVTGTITSSEAHVWTSATAAVTLASSAVVGVDQDGTACLIHTVSLGTWLSASTVTELTVYKLEHQVLLSGPTVKTWPADGTDVIQVRPQGA